MVMPFRIGVPAVQGVSNAPPIPQMPSYVQFRPNFRPRPPIRPQQQQNMLPEENLLFVGNIDDRVPNDLLHAIFESCGPVEKWQRMQGPDGRLPAFGFVGFKDTIAAILALKALHNFRIGNKCLNVRPDEKARQNMFEHVRRERVLQNLPRKRIGTELDIEEQDTEQVEAARDRAIDVIRQTHAHLLIEQDEEEPKKPEPEKERSKSPRADKERKRRKHSRERKSRPKGDSVEKKKKRRRSSSSDSSVSTHSRRSATPAAESDDSDVQLERKLVKREQRRREAEYLRQLKKFEERERRMAKQFQREDEDDLARDKQAQREAKRLGQFLEDYNDEKDDPKYYRSSSFLKRRKEYDQERDQDRLDREEETKEIAALKELVLAQEQKTAPDGPASQNGASTGPGTDPPEEEKPFRYSFIKQDGDKKEGNEPSTSQNGQDRKMVTAIQQKVISNVISVFGEDDPDEENTHVIKKKIKKFEITQQDRMENLTAEERRQMVKELINEIPTDKEELFGCDIEWEIVDADLIQERITPWVQKKIKEYIGDEEPTLVKFICEKVAAHGAPGRLLEDLAMILDDEAEGFVVKLWRLIVFQSRAKKVGLNVNSTRS